ncbi:RNase adapter RapZ [Deinococcus ruber]|uniref:Nucleotide-binding protein n=1 Tax=Deinococcus ruber TaxID=1848197 RepID=A0A918BYD4_9DEIO|nr:RNase adapter RapZ [Deinococcus ruber]GGQ98306.1 nucleotide-binding protein [Deinococcus ruber]
MPFIVVSGLSGSGKSTALRTLEDAGYFATDNLPPELWGAMSDLAKARNIERVVVSTDARTRDFLASLDASFERLKRRQEGVRIFFLEATPEVLLRRYNLSRRTHPLGDPSLLLDIAREAELLSPLRAIADTVIDTTALSNIQLAERITGLLGLPQDFDLRLTTFGFKNAPPRDVDLVLDVRTLPNPYYDPELRPKTGLNPDVARYVFQGEESEAFYEQLRGYVETSAERARDAGRHAYSVAVGCTGGQHRSVAVAERLKNDLAGLGARVIDHRDIPVGET